MHFKLIFLVNCVRAGYIQFQIFYPFICKFLTWIDLSNNFCSPGFCWFFVVVCQQFQVFDVVHTATITSKLVGSGKRSWFMFSKDKNVVYILKSHWQLLLLWTALVVCAIKNWLQRNVKKLLLLRKFVLRIERKQNLPLLSAKSAILHWRAKAGCQM